MNKLTVISTVGTSWITNCLRSDRNLLRRFLESLREPVERWEETADQRRRIEDRLIRYGAQFQKKRAAKVSSEVNSIDKIYEQARAKGQRVEVHLLTTDTCSSFLNAQLVRMWFENNSAEYPELIFLPEQVDHTEQVVEGLRIDTPEQFRHEGVANLTRKLLELMYFKDPKAKSRGFTRRNGNFLINFSGGYKAMIPILTLVGQLEQIPVQYVYEDADDILEIPQLPIIYDWGLIEELGPWLNEHYLANRHTKETRTQNEHALRKLEEHRLITRIRDNAYELTPTGEFLRIYMHQRTPYSSSSTLSYIMEYKMMEFVRVAANQRFLQYKTSYDLIKRGVPLQYEKNKSEIDILLNSSSTRDYSVIEVKSVGRLFGGKSFHDMERQLRDRHLPLLRQVNGHYPQHYTYMLYEVIGAMEPDSKNLIRQLDRLRDMVREIHPDIAFNAVLYQPQQTLTTPNIYKKLLENPFSTTDFKLIKLT